MLEKRGSSKNWLVHSLVTRRTYARNRVLDEMVMTRHDFDSTDTKGCHLAKAGAQAFIRVNVSRRWTIERDFCVHLVALAYLIVKG